MVFHQSLRDSKSPQVSSILLRILADLNNDVVWMVSIGPLICKSFRPCTKPLGTVPGLLITVGITVTFMLHSFFTSLARSRYLSLFSLSFIFILRSAGTTNSTFRQVILFCWLPLGPVIRPRLGDPFLFQNPKEFCASHFLGQILKSRMMCISFDANRLFLYSH